MDDVSWGALALSLTVLGAIWTWFAFRRRGIASGLRGAAFTLLPPAAWLTDTLQMFSRIVDAVGDWAAHLVFDPFVWLGVLLAGLSAVLFLASGLLRKRERGGRERGGREQGDQGRTGQLPPTSTKRSPVDDDLADIEALLRKRGID